MCIRCEVCLAQNMRKGDVFKLRNQPLDVFDNGFETPRGCSLLVTWSYSHLQFGAYFHSSEEL